VLRQIANESPLRQSMMLANLKSKILDVASLAGNLMQRIVQKIVIFIPTIVGKLAEYSTQCGHGLLLIEDFQHMLPGENRFRLPSSFIPLSVVVFYAD
jgi:hypothetical protein